MTVPLDERILGVVYGAACADALGGPVEGLDHRALQARHGRVTSLLPYAKPPAEHAQFSNEPGSVTDDTRLHRIVCDALIASGGRTLAGDLALAIDRWRDVHRGELERSFLEEYHYAALYREAKLPFGGHGTNGAIMANHAVGVVHAGDPRGAYRTAFELAYLSDGYGKDAAAIHAAAVAAAMRPGATARTAIDEALAAADAERRDGPNWATTVRTHDWARFEGRPNHELVARALDAVARHRDDPSERLRDTLYPLLAVSPVGSDAAQTLAVAFAMLVRCDGAYRDTVIECVAYGRDNDSYATVAGAIAGALNGIAAVPADWLAAVDAANPGLDLAGAAAGLGRVLRALHAERSRAVADVAALLDAAPAGSAGRA